jgi:hypothetical protein
MKQSLRVYQAPVITCFCSLVNTHEVHDAPENRTTVYFILNKIITDAIHLRKE